MLQKNLQALCRTKGGEGVDMWIVLGVEKQQHLNIGIKLPLKWADGMVGVLPVFEDYKSAKKYAGKRLEVQEVHTESETID